MILEDKLRIEKLVRTTLQEMWYHHHTDSLRGWRYNPEKAEFLLNQVYKVLNDSWLSENYKLEMLSKAFERYG